MAVGGFGDGDGFGGESAVGVVGLPAAVGGGCVVVGWGGGDVVGVGSKGGDGLVVEDEVADVVFGVVAPLHGGQGGLAVGGFGDGDGVLGEVEQCRAIGGVVDGLRCG